MHELSLRQIGAVNQRAVRIEYKGLVFTKPAIRCSPRGLSFARTQVCAGDIARPQGPTSQLHEAAGRTIG